MSNEREAFIEWGKSLGLPPGQLTVGEHSAFQAGAAYQREQVKGLVEALEAFDVAAKESTTIIGFAGKALKLLTNAREALAVHRAAPEVK